MEILSNLKKGLFPFIIAFTALSVSASAAFYSVSGLSKLFAGAAFEVIIMAGSLEVAKISNSISIIPILECNQQGSTRIPHCSNVYSSIDY